MKPTPTAFVLTLACIASATVPGRAAVSCTSNADCTVADACIGDACVPPVPDPDAYVAEAKTRRSSYVWAVQFPALFEPTAELCCFDYTGDQNPDDAFGTVLALASSLPGTTDPRVVVDAVLANGSFVKVFDWRELAPDLVSGDVKLSIFDGWWTDATTYPDRISGLGHVTFRLASFGPYGAFDQLNSGALATGLVDVTGNRFTVALPWISLPDHPFSIGLVQPRLEVPVFISGAVCQGLCSLDEDRGAGHVPQHALTNGFRQSGLRGSPITARTGWWGGCRTLPTVVL
jgi:hypothetical protein